MQTQDIEFIENIKKTPKDNQSEDEFTVLLNGEKDLEKQLEEFKKLCESHDKHQRQRAKRRYYNLALMAKIEISTTREEIKRLMKHNTRTFLVDVVTNKPLEVESLIRLIRETTEEQQEEDEFNKLIIGLALQITGDACRLGRSRNNCSLFLACSDTMTLTTNLAYRYSCFKEISYVLNLNHYLPYININDEISIGPEVKGVVVKKLKTSIALIITEAGIVNSYDYLELPNQCYSLPLTNLTDIFNTDLETALNLQVDFIVTPHVRCLHFVKCLQHKIKSFEHLKLIGSLDLEYISRKMLDIMQIIKYLDYLWLTNLFGNNETISTFLRQDVIPVSKCLKKPLIGSVPLERCSDFKLFENHEFLWKLDCIFIEKSAWCNKYPLIVKKLLPIKNYRLALVENTAVVHDILSNCQSVVNFIIRTISSIECQAIFLYTKCTTAAKALSRVEIYCPVFVVLSLEQAILQKNQEDINCLMDLTKNLNLRRNLRPVLYNNEMNVCDLKPIDYGIEYARHCGCLETGDFIITLEVGKENGDEHIQLGVGEDVVIMRAFYVPPLKVGEKFKCT
ncbi:uncharacterized protein LOC111682784 [Lucilia cuprina]|uniref:uncharacterized protein LOC111682784 n=1 Tax=Lucilia cuprina TaxID=7375 RepID=UPI001F067AB5|nr:uncharacterized protein LOC111682784 [Lucilia cuprina]